MELFPESSDVTVDLPTPLPPTMETKLSWVSNSGVSLSPRSLSLAASTKKPSSWLDSLALLKLTSHTAPVFSWSGSAQTLTLTASSTSVLPGVRTGLTSAWQALEEQGSTESSSAGKQEKSVVWAPSREETWTEIGALLQ